MFSTGQEQLAAVILQFEAVMRRAQRVDGLRPEIAPDAVLDMGDEIARRQARGFGEEILRPARARRAAHHAVAQNVLLGDQREVRRLETLLGAEHRDADRLAVQLARIGPVGDGADRGKAVIGQHAAHALGRTGAPRRDDDALARGLQGLDVIGGGLEDVGLAGGAFGLEVAADLAAGIDRLGRFRRLERRQIAHIVLRQRRVHSGVAQIQQSGFSGL